MLKIDVKKIKTTAVLPKFHSSGAAGADLTCVGPHIIQPGATVFLPIGITIAVPEGYEAQIRMRSGWSKKGLIMPNAPGTVDSDYRGEIGVLVRNISSNMIYVYANDRVAQMVISQVPKVKYHELEIFEELPESERGTDGFGSTGGM